MALVLQIIYRTLDGNGERGKMEMTVKQLIERLQQVEDKEKTVWALNGSDELRMNIKVVEFVDSLEIYSEE